MKEPEFPPEKRRRYKIGNHSYFWTFERANGAAKGRKILFLDDSGTWVPAESVEVWRPMSAEEVLAEVDWLRESDMHPSMIAAQLDRTPTALEQLARNHGRADLSAFFNSEAKRGKTEWRREYKRRVRAQGAKW